MAQGEEFYRTLLNTMTDGVYLVDRERRITFWSKGAERLTGFSADEVVGRHCSDGILNHVDDHGNELCGTRCPLKATILDAQARETHVWMHHREGHLQPVWVRAAPVQDEQTGAVTGAIEVFSDDSATRSANSRAAELEALALRDPLTELGNRRFLDGELVQRFGEWQRYRWRFGVLYLDVDKFKAVNDDFGHPVGDEALRLVARTLSFGVRTSDVVGRIGGEEFLVVVAHADETSLPVAAERLRGLVAQTRLTALGRRVPLSVSIGGTLVKAGDDVGALLHRADRLLYRAKAAGRNAVLLDLPSGVSPADGVAADAPQGIDSDGPSGGAADQ